MRWLIVFLAVVFGSVACGGASKNPRGGGGPDETDNGGGADALDAGGTTATPASKVSTPDGDKATDEPADKTGDDGAGDECVDQCVQANMARAVSADQIRSDCESECSDTQSPKE